MTRKGQIDREQAITSLKKWLNLTANDNTIIQASASRLRWSPTPGPGKTTDDRRRRRWNIL